MAQLFEIVPALMTGRATAASGDGNPPPAPAPLGNAGAAPVEVQRPAEDKHQDHPSGKRFNLKIGKFDGSGDLETFLMKFEAGALYNRWDEQDKLAHLMQAIEGNAAQLLHSCKGRLTYVTLLEKLRQRYGSESLWDRYRHELRSRKQKPGESLQALANDIERLSALGYPSTPPEERDSLFNLSSFLDAIADADLSYDVWRQKPRSLREALDEAVRVELWKKSKQDKEVTRAKGARGVQVEEGEVELSGRRFNNRRGGNGKPLSSTSSSGNSERPDEQQLREQNRQLAEQVRQLQEQLQAAPPGQPAGTVQQRGPSRQPRSDAATSTGETTTFKDDSKPSAYGKPPRCYNCNELGHFKSQCPHLKKAAHKKELNNQSSKSDEPARVQGAQLHGKTGKRAYLDMEINHHHCRCLLDTGCELTVLPVRLVDRQLIQPTTQRILAANGSDIPVLGKIRVMAKVGNSEIPVEGLVSERIMEPMIGIEWLEENEATWIFKDGAIQIHGQTLRLAARRRGSVWVRRVIVTEDVTVPARCEYNVPTGVQYRDLNAAQCAVQSQWATKRQELRPGFFVSGTVVPDQTDAVVVRVANLTDDTVELKKDSFLAELEPVQVATTEEAVPTATPAHIQEMLSKLDPSVPESTVIALEQLLNKYPQAFSVNELDLGWTDKVKHTIDTGKNPPARQGLRKVPMAQRSIIDKHIDEQLKQGIIEPAQSAFAANLVIVKKHDGTTRCCVDYRGLNLITKRDAYPLPRMDQCLDALGGDNYWFSVCDMRSGYYQVAMAEGDRDKTAFISHRGLHRYKVMPMGLVNAPSTFQRLMDLVMSGLLFEICLVYLDDIVIFSRTLDEHLQRLETILQRLVAAGLKLKPSKCRLLQKKVVFLGHVISSEGIATDPAKTEEIARWPVPACARDVRGFLGLCGYYRRFIDHYAEKAAPLTSLLKKNIKFRWTEECQVAFEKLKDALMSPPVLAMPREPPDEPNGMEGVYILDTDASDLSVGCVLSQMQDGQEKVIAYAARVLQPAQKNYCITRRELLAVIIFTKVMRCYLLGRRFILRTDHSALTWLKRTKEPIGQNARWLEQLEEYDFEIIHRPGVRHGNADALSRHPCPLRTPCTACKPELDAEQCNAVYPTEVVQLGELDSLAGLWTEDSLKEAQQQDSEIGPVYAALLKSSEQPSKSEIMLWSRESKMLWYQWPRLSLRDGILCRRWDEPEALIGSWQLVIPVQFRQDLFQRAHGGMTGGHLGLKKTEGQLQRRMYWPTWRADAKLWIKWCGPCAQYHRGAPPKQALLNPFPAGSPFETMSMDITGPHPRSRDGNEYILTIIDSFTKWAEAIPIRAHTAQIVARRLVDWVFSRYGVPLRLLSDQGPEFESALMAELCKSYGIEKLRTTSYKPSTNGTVERFHRTLNSMLGKAVAETQRDWDRHVGPVMAAYRATIHQSTGYTPNFLVYGRENRAPVDLVLAVGEDEPEEVGSSPDTYVQELLERQRKAYDLTRKHLGRAAERRKREYDFRVKSRQFQLGDWVYYYYPRKYKGRSPKWSRMYIGPFLVTRVLPPCNYVIQKTARSKPIVVHTDKLKLCHGITPKSWLPVDSGEEKQEPMATDDAGKEANEKEESPGNRDDEDDTTAGAVDGDEPAEEEEETESAESTECPDPSSAALQDERKMRDRGRIRRPARYDD
jgi:transposase InsO family protein/predicted aspartyl protease